MNSLLFIIFAGSFVLYSLVLSIWQKIAGERAIRAHIYFRNGNVEKVVEAHLFVDYTSVRQALFASLTCRFFTVKSTLKSQEEIYVVHFKAFTGLVARVNTEPFVK